MRQRLEGLAGLVEWRQNVEVISVGMKLRNLWFYRPALQYKLHFKHLPAGAYLRIQGRGGGEFYSFNRFETVPIDFCQFPELRVLHIDGGLSCALADTVAVRMAKCRPQMIVLGGYVPSKAPGADSMASMDKWRKARKYLHQFNSKQCEP